MKHFPESRLHGIHASMPDAGIKVREAAAWLLVRIASESGESKRRAQNRIFQLHNAQLLTSEQAQELGRLLWRAKAANGLPVGSDIAAATYLLLPAPPDEDVQALVKKHILTTPLQCAAVNGQGGTLCDKPLMTVDPMLSEAALASKPLIRLYGEVQGAIQWTGPESEVLFRRALSWWNLSKVGSMDLAGIRLSGTFEGDRIITQLELVSQCLARAVLPYMDWATDADWALLSVLLSELRSLGGFPSVALPYVLIHRPSEAGVIANSLDSDLCSNYENQIAAAANAIRHWAQLDSIGRAPALPSKLVTTLVHRIIFRDQWGLQPCLNALALILLERPDVFSRADVELIAKSLLPWHRVLQLECLDDTSQEFCDVDKPALRVLVGRLAGAIKIWFTFALPDEPEPPSITLWRDTCAKDPLPEVRRSFDAWADFQDWVQRGGMCSS